MELGTEQLRQSNLLSTWPRKQTITHITASQTQPTNNSDVVAPDFLQAELISKLVPNLAQGPVTGPECLPSLGTGRPQLPGKLSGGLNTNGPRPHDLARVVAKDGTSTQASTR